MLKTFRSLWQRLPKAPLWFAALGFAIVLGCALVFGVGCAAAPEALLLRTANGSPLHWAKVPVRLYNASDLPPLYRAEVDAAVRTWNDAVGFVVFEQVDLFVAGDSVPVIAEDCDQNADSVANTPMFARGADGTLVAAMVCLPVYSVEGEALTTIVVHELGHLLGLAHEPDAESIMYASIDSSGGNGQIGRAHV